ncbi:MAG: hypothetical protein ACRDRL_22775, partial [Sciscionella sp.]
VWLLDAALRYQPFMFTRAFATDILAPTAQGNPQVIAGPISLAAGVIADHVVLSNAAFATVQLLLGLGLLWRRSVKLALTVSIPWSLAVWWLGEGLGGVLSGSANPLTGAPGAVILYALAAILLWPTPNPPREQPTTSSVATRSPLGGITARLLWVLLWGSLAYFALQPGNRAATAPHQVISGLVDGEPGWLASLDHLIAHLLAGRGLVFSVVFAVLLVIIALGIWAPPVLTRGVLVLAILVATAIWVIGQNLGGVFTGQGTDPNSGLLLILLATAYWPESSRARMSHRRPQPVATPAESITG